VKTIAFFGGSNLVGVGYPDKIVSEDIYPNIIANHGYTIKNYGIVGASLHEIFFNCLYQLTQLPLPDIVFIEWNMFSRHRFHPAPKVELSITGSEVKSPNKWSHCIPIPTKQLEFFQKVLLLVDGDFHRIITLLQYCKIIQNFCKLSNIELIMVNGNIDWTPDLFDEYTSDSDLGLALSDSSKELLDFDNRDDNELLELLSELKEHFSQLNPEQWVFIFETFPSLMVDRAPLDNHPGPKTMKIVADRIINFLEKKKS
jgi:hypothetical protein